MTDKKINSLEIINPISLKNSLSFNNKSNILKDKILSKSDILSLINKLAISKKLPIPLLEKDLYSIQNSNKSRLNTKQTEKIELPNIDKLHTNINQPIQSTILNTKIVNDVVNNVANEIEDKDLIEPIENPIDKLIKPISQPIQLLNTKINIEDDDLNEPMQKPINKLIKPTKKPTKKPFLPIITDIKQIYNNFNNINTKIIKEGQYNFNLYLSNFFEDIIFNKFTIFPIEILQHKLKNAIILNNITSIKYHTITCPIIFLSGGSAYRSYEQFFDKKSDILPSTVDYDITCCVDFINEISLTHYIINSIETNYKILNHNNYLTNNYNFILNDNIQIIINELDKYEFFLQLINNKILITMYKHPSYNNISYRISLFRNNIKERIFDILFTTDYLISNKISNIKIININIFNNPPIYHLLPNIDSLIKMTLIAIINRSNNNLLYKKCIKDYYRLTKFLELLDKKSDYLHKILDYNPIKYKKIFNYIISIVPHCTKIINETILTTKYFDLIPKPPMNNLIKILLLYMLDNPEMDNNTFNEYKCKINDILKNYNIINYINEYKNL